MLVDTNFDSGGVHGQAFAERAAFADQHAAALAQGAVDGFDDVGLALALGTGAVRARRQGLDISR